MSNNDFSTNRHSPPGQAKSPGCCPDLSFSDGNIAILAGDMYFVLHKGVLCRHSQGLSELIFAMKEENSAFIENRPVLELQDTSEDVLYFLQALYDGISALQYVAGDFPVVSALLRLSTKYQAGRLREEILRGLSAVWPLSLTLWEVRETKLNDPSTLHSRQALPHPILLINLAQKVAAAQLLPSAFYDLSRRLPSDIAFGYADPKDTSHIHQLSAEDLLTVIRGREQASRFLSTFIVNELEGREPSPTCLNRTKSAFVERRACQIAFEAVTFEMLRDVNGLVCNRNSDPLYAIAEAELMQARGDMPGLENRSACRACEACRSEFGAVVDAAREEFWSRLPVWFGVDLPTWGT